MIVLHAIFFFFIFFFKFFFPFFLNIEEEERKQFTCQANLITTPFYFVFFSSPTFGWWDSDCVKCSDVRLRNLHLVMNTCGHFNDAITWSMDTNHLTVNDAI